MHILFLVTISDCGRLELAVDLGERWRECRIGVCIHVSGAHILGSLIHMGTAENPGIILQYCCLFVGPGGLYHIFCLL